MIYSEFSPKQIKSMLWWKLGRTKNHDAVICDGSVRSGKTLSMTIGFVMWSCTKFSGQNFAFCGKTVSSLIRNVVTPMQEWLAGTAKISLKLSRGLCEITIGKNTNRYYFFGGKDESSYQLIQGITLAGILFDEVALMPRSFVEQAMARCSVKGSKFWFNCNPDSPEHWFYKEWIQKSAEKNVLYLHFTMDDNFSLDRKIRQRYENLYSGVFYERYVLGKWVVAEGIIYSMFDKAKHVGIPEMLPKGDYYISIDYGTRNPCSMGLWLLSDDGHAYRIRESYYDARREGVQRTDEEHYAELERLAGSLTEKIHYVIIDPSALSFIECIRRHGKFRVKKADNSVLDGIRDTSSLLRAGRLHFDESCHDTFREFSLYRWDEKAGKDVPIKENDHAMDDMRYFVKTIMWRTLRDFGGESN